MPSSVPVQPDGALDQASPAPLAPTEATPASTQAPDAAESPGPVTSDKVDVINRMAPADGTAPTTPVPTEFGAAPTSPQQPLPAPDDPAVASTTASTGVRPKMFATSKPPTAASKKAAVKAKLQV